MNEYNRKVIKEFIVITFFASLGGGFFALLLTPSQHTTDYIDRFFLGVMISSLATILSMSIDLFVFKKMKKFKLLLQMLFQTLFYGSVPCGIYVLIMLLFQVNEFDILPVFIFGIFVATMIITSVTISRLLGQSTLLRLLSGRYNRPFEEERIFMFLDLKGSTTIAESLGNINFHSFLNDFFYSITPAAVECKAEIYKYIGDEVILTWGIKSGLKNLNFLRCFFTIEEAITQKQNYFLKKYGIVPEFKAGIHLGTVVVGEMGDFKKEIAYLGDVVNTTARIAGEASKRSENLLISSDVKNRISSLKWHANYTYKTIDKIALRGKSSETELITVSQL